MEKTQVETLYKQLLSSWNVQDADGMSSLFWEGGSMIGFDGSQINGQSAIKAELERIFANHQTASYVWKVQEVSFLNSQTALLRAIVGMIMPGKKEINPAANAIQSLVATLDHKTWKIGLFQNTPAQFHGRPELVQNMTAELTELIVR